MLSTVIVAIASAVSFLFLNALSHFKLFVSFECKYSPKQVVPIIVWGCLLLLCVVFKDGSIWTGVSGVVVKLMRWWIRHGSSWVVNGWGLGGLGGGQTPLGSDPISQFPRHSFIHVFIPASLSDGTSAAGTCASLCLQSLKQYFCKNHLGHMMHLSCHLSCLSMFLFAKFIAQVLLASMQISWWGDSFLMRLRFSSSFFLYFSSYFVVVWF